MSDQHPEQIQLTLPEVREQLLRLAAALGPESETEGPEGNLRRAIVDINTAAMRVYTAHRIRSTTTIQQEPQGPVQ